MKLTVKRTMKIPDSEKLARFKHAPGLGPAILFFSGGTALKKVSRKLITYTHNSIHIITPFDSGGSSATLRKAFNIPAIGDVRNRLLALADQSLHGHKEIYRLFSRRFPDNASENELLAELDTMILGQHPLVAGVPNPMRKIIRQHLQLFKELMPEEFSLCKASVGNLILTAGYIENRSNFETIINIFSRLVQVRGVVSPVVNKDLHLAAELDNGQVIVGQHLLTGKTTDPLEKRIVKLWMCRGLDNPEPVKISIKNKLALLIREADIICYPMGSFYTSLVANLLPEGVGRAIRTARAPKVYIPNTDGNDPEAYGMTIMDQITTLIHYLSMDHEGLDINNSEQHDTNEFIDYIVIDTQNGNYEGKLDKDELARIGIAIIDVPLMTPESSPLIDPEALIQALLSIL